MNQLTYEIFDSTHKKNISIVYGFTATSFGFCLIGLIDKKICYLSFQDHILTPEQGGCILAKEWKGARLIYDASAIEPIAQQIFSFDSNAGRPLTLVLKGTPFQIDVWKAVMAIPRGQTRCYEDVAQAAGNQKAVRAAASALARNNISYLIPCHRVLTKCGKIHNYRWGAQRKKAMLEHEGVVITKGIKREKKA